MNFKDLFQAFLLDVGAMSLHHLLSSALLFIVPNAWQHSRNMLQKASGFEHNPTHL